MASFLTRFKSSPFYPTFLKLLRILQLLSALSSLTVFSLRIAKLLRLSQKLSHANGAVEGILAAAVLYTLLVTLLQLCIKRGPLFLRWILVALDLAFVGAFIAISVLTNPNGGIAGPCYGQRKIDAERDNYANDPGCNLPLGTFVTAIVSTVLHALTVIFQEAKEHHQTHKTKVARNDRDSEEKFNHTEPVYNNGTHANADRV